MRVFVLSAFGLLGSAGLLLLTSEAVVRAHDVGGVSYFVEAARYLAAAVPDPRLGYRHAPNHESVYQGAMVAINARGLRDHVRPEGVETRVLLLGGSETFGWGVEAEETYGEILERIFPGVETVNAGVCGYSLRQQLDYLETDGLALNPDAVFVLVSLRRFASDDMPRTTGLYLSRLLRPVTDHPEVDIAALVGIVDLCRRSGVVPAAFFYRLRREPATDRAWARIVGAALGAGFPAYDVSPWFDGYDPERLVNSPADPNPNAEAHSILAAGIAQTLVGMRSARLP